MLIKDLQARQTNVDVEGEVTEMSDVREFSKYGRQGRVANAIIKDDSGKVKLSLWNEQIEQVKVGDKVKVLKGYVGEFQGELQLTTGKFGTMEVTKGDSAAAPAKEPVPVKESAPAPEHVAEPEPEETVEEAPESLDVEEEDFS